jgi:hypothetical protein
VGPFGQCIHFGTLRARISPKSLHGIRMFLRVGACSDCQVRRVCGVVVQRPRSATWPLRWRRGQPLNTTMMCANSIAMAPTQRQQARRAVCRLNSLGWTVATLVLCVVPLAAAPAEPNTSPAAGFWAAFAATAGLPTLPPHTPRFSVTVENVSMVGAGGAYTLPVHVVRDMASSSTSSSSSSRGVVVAAWTERDSFQVQTNAT